MKFFIPFAVDEKQAEEVYESIRQFAPSQTFVSVNDRRVYRLRWSEGRDKYVATVGEPTRADGGDIVLAILQTTDRDYLVCTRLSGGLRGEPILVWGANVTDMDEFEM